MKPTIEEINVFYNPSIKRFGFTQYGLSLWSNFVQSYCFYEICGKKLGDRVSADKPYDFGPEWVFVGYYDTDAFILLYGRIWRWVSYDRFRHNHFGHWNIFAYGVI